MQIICSCPLPVPLSLECVIVCGVWQELLCVTGSLEACSSETPDEQKSVFRDALQSALAHSLTHEVLSASQVNSRFPGYHLPADYQVISR